MCLINVLVHFSPPFEMAWATGTLYQVKRVVGTIKSYRVLSKIEFVVSITTILASGKTYKSSLEYKRPGFDEKLTRYGLGPET